MHHTRRGASRRGAWTDVEHEAPGRTQDARHATLRTEVVRRRCWTVARATSKSVSGTRAARRRRHIRHKQATQTHAWAKRLSSARLSVVASLTLARELAKSNSGEEAYAEIPYRNLVQKNRDPCFSAAPTHLQRYNRMELS